MGTLLNPFVFAAPGIAYTTDKSLDLSGGDYVNFGNVMGALAAGASPWTFEGYFEFDNLNPGGGGLSVLLNKRQASPAPGSLIYVNTAGGLFVFIEGTGGAADRLWARSVTGVVSTGAWTHIAMTYDGSKNTSGVQFYVGGVLQTKDTDLSNSFTTTAANSRDVWVGSRETFANSYMDGRIHRMSVWDKVLSLAEVVEARDILDANGLNGHSAAANLVWYPRFGNDPLDDATGGTGVIKDRVGGFDGAPIGTVAGNIVTDAP